MEKRKKIDEIKEMRIKTYALMSHLGEQEVQVIE